MTFDEKDWANESSPLVQYILASNAATIEAYRARPILVYEHANIERATAQGGYGRRQLFELIQNGADALVGTREGRIMVVLTEGALYCANHGEPINQDGVDALLSSHISEKRGSEIGRFGLGFKSVLGVTSSPEFYSWTASFAFDAEWAHDSIIDTVRDLGSHNEDMRTPVLRLAAPLEVGSNAQKDPTLNELMSWATTVVKLPFGPVVPEWLAEDLASFPAEFLLFSAHVGELRIEDRTNHLTRSIHVSQTENRRVLTDNKATSDWMVFEEPKYKPTPEALADAGELAHRESVPLIWAVPLAGRERTARGRFWAFFPTEYETTMAGILNAPWKTNEDRQNLLSGRFNEELLGVMARMLVDNLPNLLDETDPGRFLELLPGRGRESANWADSLITERVYEQASDQPSLPDQGGVLRSPAELRIHPEPVDAKAMEAWMSYEGRPKDWVHGSVLVRDRRARALRLILAADGNEDSVSGWLEAICEDYSVDGSRAAVKAASALLAADSRVERQIRDSNIVLTSDEQLALPRADVVFFPRDYSRSTDEMHFVHEDLAADPETHAALIELGIHEADALGELKALLLWGPPHDQDWDEFWALVERSDPRGATDLLSEAAQEETEIFVRVTNGEFRPWNETLIPGRIVSNDNPDDSGVAVDVVYHADHLLHLRELGVSDGPLPDGGSELGNWFVQYEGQCRRQYYESLPLQSARPHEYLLRFESAPLVGPLEPLLQLSSVAAAKFTLAALELIEKEEWEFGHQTQEKYPRLSFTAPDLWLVRTEGWAETSLGPMPVSDAVGPELNRWEFLLPVAKWSSEMALLAGLPSSPADIPEEVWDAAFERALLSDGSGVGSFYAEASYHAESPHLITCRRGDRSEALPPDDVTVVFEEREFRALTELDDPVPVLLVQDEHEADALTIRWQLVKPETQVRSDIIYQPMELGSTIADCYPQLALILDDQQLDVVLLPCEAIQIVTLTAQGRRSEETDAHFDREEHQILVRSDLSELQILEFICKQFSLRLDRDEMVGIVESRMTAEKSARMSDLAKIPDDAARVIQLVEPEALKAHLPQDLIDSVDERALADPLELARLALAVHGVSILKELRSELVQSGWPAPSHWAGSRDARAFVAALGFDRAFAGFETRRLEPLLSVDGPAELPPMHTFQSQISSRIEQLVEQGKGRGLISLPTGAGKTRVVVESLISSIKAGKLAGPILWVAQTEELCEQAIQTWAFIWRAIGASHYLHLSRLWGANEATDSGSVVQVVVATIAKLDHLFDKDSYEWLSRAGCVVIDEAHGSITPQYTRLFDWQGMARGKDRVPLMGLTATPFRGTSEEETERLVSRYQRNRLDHGVFDGQDPYAFLQDQDVLAKVDHELLQGSEIHLTDDELGSLNDTRLLPATVGQRLGADADRNETLISSIGNMPRDWPILVFAASVDHAHTMAALLSRQGITARSISAATDRGARRHYVEAFRNGEIQVLTNYNVLSQGFDAPATRAVYIARPTFSPNLYQQMIGRGLRGPANGGKETCLIVNVEDNFSNFGESLAFHDFEYLWHPTPSSDKT